MYWYLTLFATAFIAASLFPGSPDAILIIMINNNLNIIWGVIIATLGSYLGACLNYYLGLGVQRLNFLNKWKPSDTEVQKALLRYKKFGYIGLFFSWIPIVGDPLTFVAGYLKIDLFEFSICVILGRLIRFLVVAGVTTVALYTR